MPAAFGSLVLLVKGVFEDNKDKNTVVLVIGGVER